MDKKIKVFIGKDEWYPVYSIYPWKPSRGYIRGDNFCVLTEEQILSFEKAQTEFERCHEIVREALLKSEPIKEELNSICEGIELLKKAVSHSEEFMAIMDRLQKRKEYLENIHEIENMD